uniref:Uncharacterized protein n=1 Tax=Medicago truncatula TaxID=3880 RepID=I3S618_MEDTR|nr:unknown [Medicago truncatula]
MFQFVVFTTTNLVSGDYFSIWCSGNSFLAYSQETHPWLVIFSSIVIVFPRRLAVAW